ncbi:MAG: YicC/YloC family endoribonuclease [Candidatus Amoebophilus sp.]
MQKSMTGFGKAIYEDDQLRVSVEARSVNSKHADVSLQVPKLFTEQTLAWRNLIITYLHRGKIEVTVSYEAKQKATPQIVIQEPLFKAYYKMLEQLANDVSAHTNNIFDIALKTTGVMVNATDKAFDTEIDEHTRDKIEDTIRTALQKCDQTREEEGKTLLQSISSYLYKITQELALINSLDSNRLEVIRTRLLDKLKAISPELPIDELRLEQELVYHLEKLDITEEKVRLANHLAYFEKVMQHEEIAGKKLTFITQEIGRELNTLGVKANDATIQQYVIVMKNELEKIKEQLQNIL